MERGGSLPWIWWSVGALITFILVGAAVFVWDQHPALLLGWAIGMILGAVLMLFHRPGR
jgi:hypothetical protein